MSSFVYHESGEVAQVRIDGKSFEIPSHELYEVEDVTGTDSNNNGPQEYRIPAHMVAKLICQHAWYHGMQEVEVKVGKGGKSIESTLDAAKAKAAQLCRDAEEKIFKRYVEDQSERMRQNLGAVPPSGRIVMIIEKRGIDLADYHINPVGWNVKKDLSRDEQLSAMQQQIEELKAMLADKPKKKEPVHA